MEANNKVVTDMVRFAYQSVFEPVAEGQNGALKYHLCVMIPKEDKATMARIKAAINSAIQEKASLVMVNGKIDPNFRYPIHDGDTKSDGDTNFKGFWYFNCKSNYKPEVVDANCNPIISKEDFYSGCWGRVSVSFFVYTKQGKGITCVLQNVQKLRDDTPFTGGASAADDFGTPSPMAMAQGPVPASQPKPAGGSPQYTAPSIPTPGSILGDDDPMPF